MSATTKARILDAAEEIMLTKSFHSVGLNEILAAVKVPKGSFYHYFESKEQFGVELLRHYVSEHSARLRRMLLESRELNPAERLMTLINGTIGRLLEGECRQFCLVGKLGAEVSTFSEGMREVLAEGMREWRGIYEELIREGQRKGVMRQDLDARVAAGILQDAWQGAVHRSQIERSVQPARETAKFLQGYLTGE